MLQNSITIKNRHNRFIETVCETEIIYGLKNKNGFATSNSVHYNDKNDVSIGIICFWSERARAKSCIRDKWKGYEPVEISLSDFMENWCIGMYSDNLLIGTQFDKNMFGFEIEPLELILQISAELDSIEKKLTFRKFDRMSDFIKQVKISI